MIDQTEAKIKALKKKAQSLIDKVQRRINTKGAYENAGVKEEHEFSDLISKAKLHYQDECKLKDFIRQGMDNLDYSQTNK